MRNYCILSLHARNDDEQAFTNYGLKNTKNCTIPTLTHFQPMLHFYSP